MNNLSLGVTNKMIKEGKRKTRFVTLNISGLAGFTELILTPEEKKKLNAVKLTLVGKEIKLSPNAFNRTDHVGKITDIRIVVTHSGVHPSAIIEFPDQGYSRLRFLKDIEWANSVEFLEQLEENSS
jgi:hypothetical protein